MNIIRSAMYSKILRLSTSAKKFLDQGKIMNLLTIDTASIFGICQMGGFLFSSPIMIVVAMALIIVEIGWIGLLTPVIFVIMSILNSKIGDMFIMLRKLIMS